MLGGGAGEIGDLARDPDILEQLLILDELAQQPVELRNLKYRGESCPKASILLFCTRFDLRPAIAQRHGQVEDQRAGF